MNKDAYKLKARKVYYIILIIMLSILACGQSKKSKYAFKKIEITITGLDGNEVAEKNIRTGLMNLKGVETVSFNYLNNQVVVLFDTIAVSEETVLNTIRQLDNGRYKILDVKENNEPNQKADPVIPNPQEDIQDDISDEYKDNV